MVTWQHGGQDVSMGGGPVQQSTGLAAVAGGLTTVLVWVLNTYFIHTPNPPIPDSITGVLIVAVMALVTHFVPDKPAPPIVSGTVSKTP